MSRVIVVSNIKTGVAGAVYDALTKDTPYDPSYSYIEYPCNGEVPYAEWEKFGDQWKSRGWEPHMHFKPWASEDFDPDYSCRTCGEYISNQCEKCSEKEWSELRKQQMELENQNAIAKAIANANAREAAKREQALAEDALLRVLAQRASTEKDLLPEERDYLEEKKAERPHTPMAYVDALDDINKQRAAKIEEIKKRRGLA